ncbi:hypothetical protein [Alterisphingorhabdus coralli]|uniref:Uncharacterized protein n=1 Tax=Alterisphingorhabdus coralli TaxID=3071408 RepID=A0AA97FAJ7_9SPHN|nr:hypothetical protein [Parasphingorhabdus sp. SCSIO 66989]WOE76062.1 hypothetical protein RB602_04910 [Parasphingorhabdus sp. SCSIO 66989]
MVLGDTDQIKEYTMTIDFSQAAFVSIITGVAALFVSFATVI